MTSLHVVFGAGQIGPLVAEKLVRAGQRVRVVRRSAAPLPTFSPRSAGGEGQGEGGTIELVRADAMDPAACAEAVRGASTVYHCINAPYFAEVWEETLPRIQENLVAAAARAGARLVVLDNLYALGRPGGRPMDEETPQAPCSRKGELRARLHEALSAAVARGDVRAAVGRASDFFGPGAWAGSFLGERFWPAALAGKAVAMPVRDLGTRHTYHFTRDVAEGLVALGLDAGAEGTWMLPCAPAVATRDLVARLGAALGRPIAVKTIPRPILWAGGLALPILRELNEMAYQWEEDFVVDDARFRARYGDRATPLDEAARLTVQFARAALTGAAPSAA
jgi:nucleoside-diphosphate-sugar epimerase